MMALQRGVLTGGVCCEGKLYVQQRPGRRVLLLWEMKRLHALVGKCGCDENIEKIEKLPPRERDE